MKALLFSIVWFGLIIRIVGLNAPTDYNAYRQHLTSSVIKNLGNPFRPQIDDDKRYDFMQEFPMYQLIAKPFAEIGHYSWFSLRITSVFWWLVALFLLWKIFPNPIALILFTFSPLSIAMSRSCQPDMMMIAFQLLTIWAFWRKRPFLGFLGLLGAGLVKVSALAIILPILWLKPQKKGILAIICGVMAVFWWWVIYSGPIRTVSGYEGTKIYNLSYILSSIAFQLSHLGFYKETLWHIFYTTLTPLGFILLIWGMIKHWNWFWGLWVIAVLISYCLLPEQSRQEYYILTLIVPASYFISKAYEYTAN